MSNDHKLARQSLYNSNSFNYSFEAMIRCHRTKLQVQALAEGFQTSTASLSVQREDGISPNNNILTQTVLQCKGINELAV